MTLHGPILTLDALGVLYNPAIVALQGVSLSVRTGSIHALLGANGAGKTTTLRAISGLLSAERGRVAEGRLRLDGQDIAGLTPADLVRRGVAPVLEGRHCFRSLSIEENLLTGGIGAGASRRALRQRLERVYHWFPRLWEKRATAAGLNSGGEQQMAAIGRALMAEPRFLLLDEPSMGLAPLVVRDIFTTLARLNAEEGLTILVAEQNSTVALRHAHHATVIENGISVLDGPAAELAARSDIKAFYLGEAPPPGQEPGAAA